MLIPPKLSLSQGALIKFRGGEGRLGNLTTKTLTKLGCPVHFTCKVPRWCPKTPISFKGEQYFSFCSQQTCFTDKSSLATWFQLLQNLPIMLWEIHIEKKSICMSRRDLSGWFCSSNIFHSSFVHRKYIKQIKWHIKVHRGTHFIIGLFLWHLANHSKGAQPTFCNMFLLETCLS